jgi:hypothetical protein
MVLVAFCVSCTLTFGVLFFTQFCIEHNFDKLQEASFLKNNSLLDATSNRLLFGTLLFTVNSHTSCFTVKTLNVILFLRSCRREGYRIYTSYRKRQRIRRTSGAKLGGCKPRCSPESSRSGHAECMVPQI